MIRVRFKANLEDYRSVLWPVKHPYWCTGHSEFHSIVVAYADNEKEIYKNWPEAEDLDIEEVTEYLFTSRFPKPSWLIEDSS